MADPITLASLMALMEGGAGATGQSLMSGAGLNPTAMGAGVAGQSSGLMMPTPEKLAQRATDDYMASLMDPLNKQLATPMNAPAATATPTPTPTQPMDWQGFARAGTLGAALPETYAADRQMAMQNDLASTMGGVSNMMQMSKAAQPEQKGGGYLNPYIAQLMGLGA